MTVVRARGSGSAGHSYTRRMSSGRRRWLIRAAIATGVFLLTALVVHPDRVSSSEAELFRAVNAGPSWLYQPVWPIMQFGNVVVAIVVALLAGAAMRRWRVAAAGALAGVAAWYVAKLVKNLVERGRPGAYLTDVRIPGVAEDGFGFISGHSTVAFALATVVAAAVPRRWHPVPFAIATIVAIARLYVGVHLPLDVLGGAAAGIAIGAVVAAGFDLADADQSVATSPTGQATPVPPSPQ
jgi:membrane-associated phospholipid phosphatase